MSGTCECERRHYEGVSGTLRFLRESCVDGFRFLKADIQYVWSVVVGEAPTTGETCVMNGCGDGSVGTFPRSEPFADDYDVCRRHWLLLHGVITAVKLLIVGAPLVLFAYLVVMVA